jgi:hypothetical protein
VRHAQLVLMRILPAFLQVPEAGDGVQAEQREDRSADPLMRRPLPFGEVAVIVSTEDLCTNSGSIAMLA